MVLTITSFATLIIGMYIIMKWQLGEFVSFENKYITKRFVGSLIFRLVIYTLISVVWYAFLNAAFTSDSEKILNQTGESSDAMIVFMMIALLSMVIITSVLVSRVLKYMFYFISVLIRLNKQKKNTISNLLIKAIHNESDEVIVKRYSEMDKAPLLPYEEPNLTQAEEMKLISALINMGEIETAKQLGKEFVRTNKKLVKNQVAFKKIGKSKKTLQARSSSK